MTRLFFGIAEALPLHAEALLLQLKALLLQLKALLLPLKALLLPFRDKIGTFYFLFFTFTKKCRFFARNLTKVTWYSLIPVFMRLHASDLSLRYLTYTSLTGHLEVTSSMYKMLSLLFWLSLFL